MFMSRHVVMAVSALALALAGAAQAQETLRIGTEGAYPPFNTITSDGQLEGFDIDIAKALCEEMEVECVFVTQDWDGIIPALQAGRYDAIIASMSITDERKKQVDFSGKYYNTPPAIAVPKDSDIEDSAPQSLAGKSLGVQGSTTHSNYAEAAYGESDIRMYPTADEYKLDLVNGRIDAAMDDVTVLSEWLKTSDGACCKIADTITPVPEIHGEGAGIAVRKGETELVERLNAAIKAIRANGTYKEINDRYFDFDAYGGDA